MIGLVIYPVVMCVLLLIITALMYYDIPKDDKIQQLLAAALIGFLVLILAIGQYKLCFKYKSEIQKNTLLEHQQKEINND